MPRGVAHPCIRARPSTGVRVQAALESAFTFLFKYPPRLFGRGEFVLAPVVPVWLIALAILGSVALVVLAYRNLRGISRVDRIVLGATRALALVLDDSRSMRVSDVNGASRTQAMRQEFSDTSALVRQLATRYNVRTFRFAAEPTPALPTTPLNASGGRTDLAAALDGVGSDLAGLPVA